ncbi:hypothetical protein ACIBCC_29830 [Streptomyces griseus]|uniref:hypothetical protein n=1 Tax=Streptomyces griseus TaxID=1911 RepID=UPI0037954FBB
MVTLNTTATYIVIGDTAGTSPRLTPGNTVIIKAAIRGSANAERYAAQLANAHRQCDKSPTWGLIEVDAESERHARRQAREYFAESA